MKCSTQSKPKYLSTRKYNIHITDSPIIPSTIYVVPTLKSKPTSPFGCDWMP